MRACGRGHRRHRLQRGIQSALPLELWSLYTIAYGYGLDDDDDDAIATAMLLHDAECCGKTVRDAHGVAVHTRARRCLAPWRRPLTRPWNLDDGYDGALGITPGAPADLVLVRRANATFVDTIADQGDP